MRKIPGRSGGRRQVVTGFTWLPPEQVPGAILSPKAQRELQEKLDALREWEARSRASARSYVIYR
jgi:hypothetical protein